MLRLWCRPEATAPTLCLAWEFPYAMDAALKRPKKFKNTNKYFWSGNALIYIDLFSSVKPWKSQVILHLQDKTWSSYCGTVETNPTGNHEVAGLIPGFAQWVKDLALLSCGIGHRLSSDPVWL